MHTVRSMRKQVPVPVHGTALHRYVAPHRGDGAVDPRRAIDDQEFRPPQTAPDQIVEHAAPSLGAFAAHVLDGEQNLLPIGAYSKHDEQRNRRGLAVEPDANYPSVKDEPHDRLLGEVRAFQAS